MKNKCLEIELNRGFAALILVVSISAMMLAFSFTNLIEYGHYFDEVKNKEYRLIAYYSAYSCIDQALLALNHDYFFTVEGNEIQIPDLNCSILSITNVDDKKMIRVLGKINKIIVYRLAVARLFDDHLEIISIE